MDKNSLALFCDAHFHLLPSEEALKGMNFSIGKACSAAHSAKEFLAQEKRVLEINQNLKESGGFLIQSFGLHPQEPLLENLDFLEGLLKERRIQAVGECGLDFFTKDFLANKEAQDKAFDAQIELAARFKIPALIHARKAMQEIFERAQKLKELPSVIFHSFAGSPMDALSLLNKGINAYFSFGKPLMNGNKKAISCVRSLPMDRLLFETDAPYQSLKGEVATSPNEIADVCQTAFEIRNSGLQFEARPSFASFSAAIEENFSRAYCLKV
ncbi:MAG: TatD family hydrolase [Treponema sp.]|nr:TatD family hydrolase [Treponema sp.]